MKQEKIQILWRKNKQNQKKWEKKEKNEKIISFIYLKLIQILLFYNILIF